MTPRQLALDFPALARDPAVTYVDVECQDAARRALSEWRDWPGGVMALVGPPGAGKTHLAALWARAVDAAPASMADVEAAAGATLVEDADRRLDESQLLAWLERARSGAVGPLLFTARAKPAAWGVALPDLASRVGLAAVVEIDDPTDADLAAVFAKALGDRGADASAALIGYVIRRIERSFAAAVSTAEALDRAGLERKQRLTRTLAADVLGDDHAGGDEPALAPGTGQDFGSDTSDER